MLVNLPRRPAFSYSLWKLRLIEKITVYYKAPGDYLKFTQIFVICIPIDLEMFNNHAHV